MTLNYVRNSQKVQTDDRHKGQTDPFASEHLTHSFHRMRRPTVTLPFVQLTVQTTKSQTVNLYRPALISYGSSILVITLALYLALDGECWRRIVMQSDSTGLNFRQRVRVGLKPRWQTDSHKPTQIQSSTDELVPETNREARLTLSWWEAALREPWWDRRSEDDLGRGGGGEEEGSSSSTSSSTTIHTRLARSDRIRTSAHSCTHTIPLTHTHTNTPCSLLHTCTIQVHRGR